MKKQMIGVLMLSLTALIWGVAFVAQSVGMQYIGPYTFNCIRFLVGFIVLTPVILILRKNEQTPKISKERKERKKNTVIGGILCGIILCAASLFQQYGIMYTTVGKAGFITTLYIIFVPLIGILFKKKITILVGISTVMATVGFYLLCMSGHTSIEAGDSLLLICAVIFSMHILCVDYFSPKANGVEISWIQFLVSGFLSGICMFVFEKPQIAHIVDAMIPILYAGVLSCGVAYTLQIVGQKRVQPTVASLVMSLESVFSVLAGWLILNQKLSLKEGLGCLLVFLAVILAQLPSQKKMNRTSTSR